MHKAKHPERAVVRKVMHHGAAVNWQPEVARTLKNAVSRFSSDPNKGTRSPLMPR